MKKKSIRKIGLLTAGGDCPGLNAVIRAVVKTATNQYGVPVMGIQDGYWGLIHNQMKLLRFTDASGIMTRGGTVIGASNKDNPFHQAVQEGKKIVIRDCRREVLDTIRQNDLDALIVVGGDGSLETANRLSKLGVPVVGIPKTIDNDVWGTEKSVGFSTAVATATEAIDKLHTTALSHNRVLVVEIMGRYCGWLTLASGVASGSDVILIPEIPYDLDAVCRAILERHKTGKRFSIVAVAEGARPKHGKMVVREMDRKRTDPVRLGGIGEVLTQQISKKTGLETRVTVLGHLVRGGGPVAEDRLLATQFGKFAVDNVMRGKFGVATVWRAGAVHSLPLKQVASKVKRVPKNHPFIAAALSVGTSFGQA